MTSTTSNTTNKQPQTTKDIIAANVKTLIEQLEAGHSDALTVYLTAMGRFHSYSLGNILEIARQAPEATRVARMYTWNQLGRRVKKGEKGIRILAPMIGIRKKKDSNAQTDITKQNEPVVLGFRNAYVFDVLQTDGADLPHMERTTGDAGENYDRLLAFIEKQGIELVFTEKIAPALGASYGGRIAILPGRSKAETFATLVHEVGHELLMHAARRTTTTKTVRETEAEAIAFVVSKAIGLETGSASASYISLYHGNASLSDRELGGGAEDGGNHPLSLRATHQRASRDARRGTCEGGLVQTILHILKKAGGWHPGLYLKIENPPYMALVIEAMDESGPLGLPAISVAHYGEQNGDLMRDPEMCFELGLAGGPHLNPFHFRQDYIGIERWSRAIVCGHYVHLVSLHQQHEQFANMWDNNLRAQDFADAFERQQHTK